MSNEAVRIKKRNDIASRISTYLVLALVAILCAGPFIWLVLSSLRTGANIYDLHFSLKNFTLSNYTGVIRYMNLGKYVGNTVIITVVGIVIDVVFVLTKGGPNNATTVINYYSYTKAFGDFQFGYAAAIGAIQGILTTMLSIIVFVYGKRGGMTNNE